MRNIEEITTLAIDTSCDETSVAVVKGKQILSNLMPSQMQLHSKFGGVVPSIAKLAHIERIDKVVNEAIKRSKLSIAQIDTISVTYGPGLAIALEVGLKKAKQLAQDFNKPLIAINHMEGHLLSALALPNSKMKLEKKLEFPSLGFLISGGHTELVYIEDYGKYQKIGETVDDSCGEAYDKCGRIMGFGYPAGPVITKFAKENRKNFEFKLVKENLSVKIQCTNKENGKCYELPIAMVNSGNLNFSYSGLKTAFKQLVESITANSGENLSKEQIIHLCVLFEAVAIEQLRVKLEKPLKQYEVKTLLLGGGVVASAQLRNELRKTAKKFNVDTLCPYTKKLTGDNAAMIGLASNIKVSRLESLNHNPQELVFTKDFDSLDRAPSLSL
jgi:N6-L-threonylcarbamoyladenine synthase